MADVSTRGLEILVSQKLITETCCNCGMLFAMTEDYRRRALESRGPNGVTFCCPQGHRQWYTGKTEAEKLQEQLDAERRQRQRAEQRVAQAQDEAEHERRRANGYKGHATRITKRAKAGICPCCKRHFVALERHMATKHPQFTPLEVIEGGKAA